MADTDDDDDDDTMLRLTLRNSDASSMPCELCGIRVPLEDYLHHFATRHPMHPTHQLHPRHRGWPARVGPADWHTGILMRPAAEAATSRIYFRDVTFSESISVAIRHPDEEADEEDALRPEVASALEPVGQDEMRLSQATEVNASQCSMPWMVCTSPTLSRGTSEGGPSLPMPSRRPSSPLGPTTHFSRALTSFSGHVDFQHRSLGFQRGGGRIADRGFRVQRSGLWLQLGGLGQQRRDLGEQHWSLGEQRRPLRIASAAAFRIPGPLGGDSIFQHAANEVFQAAADEAFEAAPDTFAPHEEGRPMRVIDWQR